MSQCPCKSLLGAQFVNHLSCQPFEVIQHIFVNVFQVMDQVDCDSVQQVILLRWSDVLKLDVCNFLYVPEQILFAFQVNCQTNPFLSCSSGSSRPVDVIVNLFWRLKLNNEINMRNIKSSSSYVG